MGARQIRAGGAFVELNAKLDPLQKGLRAAEKHLKTWGAGISAVGSSIFRAGAAAVAPLAAASKVFASSGDAIAKAATRTGIGAEQISALGYAAEQSGSSLEELEGGLKHMNRAIDQGKRGSAEAVSLFQSLGLSMDELRGLAPDKAFLKIADRLSMIQNPGTKAARAMDIFGKSGEQLIPLMEGGAAGIEELTAAAARLGLVWSTKDAKAAEEYGDRLDDLWKTMKRSTAAVGGALVPILRQATVAITENVVKVTKWIDTHRKLVVAAFQTAAGVTALGAGLVVLGKGVSVVGAAMGAFASAIGVAGKVMGVLTSGVGLVTVGLAGLGVYLLTTTESGKATMQALGDSFKDVGNVALQAFQGIKDAMTAGDWKLAADVLWKGLDAAWKAGIQPLEEIWVRFKGKVVRAAIEAVTGVIKAWEIGRATLLDTWSKATQVMGDLWRAFVGTVLDSINDTSTALGKVIKLLKLTTPGGFLLDDGKTKEQRTADTLARQKAEVDAANEAQRLRDQESADIKKKLAEKLDALEQGKEAAISAEAAVTAAEVAGAGERAEAAKKALAAATKAAGTAKRNAAQNDPMGFFGLPTPEAIADLIEKLAGVPDAVGELTQHFTRPRQAIALFDTQRFEGGDWVDIEKAQLNQLMGINKGVKNLNNGPRGVPVI